MDLRRKVIGSYLRHFELVDIIAHHRIVHTKTVVIYGLALGLLMVGNHYLTGLINHDSMSIMRTIVGVVLYILFIVDIADKYMDALVITTTGLVHFNREHIFKHKTTSFQRHAIEKISEEQSTIIDTLLNKGDIKIMLEDRLYTFEQIGNPGKKVGDIAEYKQQYTTKLHHTEFQEKNDAAPQERKNEILMEALSEVITDYLEKKKG